MEDNNYFIHINGQQLGPFTFEQLAREGIHAQTMVWRPGMEQWAPASTVPELNALIERPEPKAESVQEAPQTHVYEPATVHEPEPEPEPGPRPEPEPEPAGRSENFAPFNVEPAIKVEPEKPIRQPEGRPEPAEEPDYSRQRQHPPRQQEQEYIHYDNFSQAPNPYEQTIMESIRYSWKGMSVWGIIFSILSFNIVGLVIGIIAVVKSNSARRHMLFEFYMQAYTDNHTSKILGILSFILGLVSLISLLACFIIFEIWRDLEYLEFLEYMM